MTNNSNIINGLYHKSEYLVNCRKEKNMVMLILHANFAKTFHSIHTQLMTLMNMKRTPILPLLLIMLLLISCDRQLSKSLELAGDNRAEMEKVLEHFKHDPDPLKYKAARFLIENMPYHYSYEGEAVEKYDSAYLRMAEEPKQFRDSVFGLLTQNIAINDRKCIDIATLKAEYLIQAIDDACNVWSEATWHGDFDESVFFDYVLPYRILNEPLTNWRDCINAEYTYLSANEVQSKRGEQIEAESALYGSCKIVDKASASNGQVVLLRDGSNMVTFEYESSTCSKKVIHLRYTSISRNAQVSIVHNGKNVASLCLEPTSTMDVFRDTRKGADVVLQPGKNTKVSLRKAVRSAWIMSSSLRWKTTRKQLKRTSQPHIAGYRTRAHRNASLSTHCSHPCLMPLPPSLMQAMTAPSCCALTSLAMEAGRLLHLGMIL